MNRPDDEYEMMMTAVMVIAAISLCIMVTWVFLAAEPYVRG